MPKCTILQDFAYTISILRGVRDIPETAEVPQCLDPDINLNAGSTSVPALRNDHNACCVSEV